MRRTCKCLHCGKEFTTSSGIQKYCSVDCTEAAKAERKKKRERLLRDIEPIADLSQVDYLTISKAAILMGCSRQYVYKLIGQGRLRASRLSNRMSYVRRVDIEALLAISPYTRVIQCQRPKSFDARKPKEKAKGREIKAGQTKAGQVKEERADEPLEFYTAEEVMSTHKVGQSWLYTCAKRYGIRTCRIATHLLRQERH